MIEYNTTDDISMRTIDFAELSPDWAVREPHTQHLGDEWLNALTEALLIVPSVIVPLSQAFDRNVLINHRHPQCARITVASVTPFSLDPRLF
jgi:RES domain-containing protein